MKPNIIEEIQKALARHINFYNIQPRHILIDKEIYHEIRKQASQNLIMSEEITHLLGMKIIVIKDLHSPHGKVDYIFEGTKWR